MVFSAPSTPIRSQQVQHSPILPPSWRLCVMPVTLLGVSVGPLLMRYPTRAARFTGLPVSAGSGDGFAP